MTAATQQDVTDALLPPEHVTPVPDGAQLIVYVTEVTGLRTRTVAWLPGAS